MALNFKNYERAERVTLGTVGSIIGIGGSVKPISIPNFLNEEVRVQLVLTLKDGTSDKVTCSPEVSKRLRSKELTLSQLVNFEVEEQISLAGEVYNMIKMPSTGASLPGYVVTGEEKAYEPVATFNLEELVAF
jgi:hypothetical protein